MFKETKYTEVNRLKNESYTYLHVQTRQIAAECECVAFCIM